MSIKKLTIKGLKKNKFKLTSFIGLFLLVVAVLAGLYLVRQNQNINEEAAGGCKSYNDDRKACEASCGGAKKDGSTYKCRFGKNGCVETSKKCTDGRSGGGAQQSVCSSIGGSCVTAGTSCEKTIIQTPDCNGNNYCCTPWEMSQGQECKNYETRIVNCGVTQSFTRCRKDTCVNGSWKKGTCSSSSCNQPL